MLQNPQNQLALRSGLSVQLGANEHSTAYQILQQCLYLCNYFLIKKFMQLIIRLGITIELRGESAITYPIYAKKIYIQLS